MSIRCAMGVHSWKPQFIRLPYKVKEYAIDAFLGFFGEYETSNFMRGYRCARCRGWKYPPKDAPLPRITSQCATTANKLREQQNNEYLSMLAKNIPTNQNAWASLSQNQQCRCNCRCNRGNLA